MSKTVLFFPGQASQYVGMGKELYDDSSAVRELYSLASDEIGVDIARISFEGPTEELKKTRFTQPAILLHSLAVMIVAGDRLPSFHYACGHSLGEYSALAAVGVLSHEDAVRAVVRRAYLMEEACNENPGTMAAILGLNEEKTAAVCNEASSVGVVNPANFNSKVQIAISGSVSAVKKAVTLATEAGAKRAVMLEVGGAFHSPLMEPARVGLEAFLDDITFNKPKCPVIANVTGGPVTNGDDVPRLLVDQVTAPVKWVQTMNWLKENDVGKVIEIGPGKVLTSLAKRDMRPEMMLNLDTLSDINALEGVTI